MFDSPFGEILAAWERERLDRMPLGGTLSFGDSQSTESVLRTDAMVYADEDLPNSAPFRNRRSGPRTKKVSVLVENGHLSRRGLSGSLVLDDPAAASFFRGGGVAILLFAATIQCEEDLPVHEQARRVAVQLPDELDADEKLVVPLGGPADELNSIALLEHHVRIELFPRSWFAPAEPS